MDNSRELYNTYMPVIVVLLVIAIVLSFISRGTRQNREVVTETNKTTIVTSKIE